MYRCLIVNAGRNGLLPNGIVALLLLVMGPSGMAAENTVKGSALYHERIAMPPAAVFEATLANISRADALAEVIGKVRIASPGTPPIRFEIPYDGSRINPKHTYSVRARVTVGERLLFSTDQFYPVLTHGAGNEVSLLLRKTGAVPAGNDPVCAHPLGHFPATFTGDLPCADCPGIHYQVDLFPDRVFFLRMTYLDKERRFDDIGRWALSSDGTQLVIEGRRKASERFAIREADTLVKLDLEGREIDSELNYSLRRTPEVAPIEPQLPLAGMYQYMADAALFTECLTGRRMPVAPEADNLALEQAYLAARHELGATLMVNLEGRIALRPNMEGQGEQPTLIVDRFIDVHPGQSCNQPFDPPALEDTYWQLVRLGDDVVIVRQQQHEPHIVFQAESQRVSGSGGCNRFMGKYTLDGNNLTFSKLATTKRACPAGMDTEQALHAVLGQVRSWRVTGQHLALLGDDGGLLARFKAKRGD
ncbi:MAG: META domain-containing protein [Gammaproteobacteria bacterium]